jgi:hypothetical protein
VIEKNDILYLFIVVIISAILASAWAGMNHDPVPLQVQENRLPIVTFAPAAAPAPAMPTYGPQLVPGSYADTHPNSTANGNFSPAPAPVIVTTMPLPTITAIPTTAAASPVTTKCCNNAFNASIMSTTQTLGSAFNILGIALFMAGIAFVIYAAGGLFRISPVAVFTATLDTAVSKVGGDSEAANQAIIAGVMAIMVGGMIYIIAMAILPAIVASAPVMTNCVPC